MAEGQQYAGQAQGISYSGAGIGVRISGNTLSAQPELAAILERLYKLSQSFSESEARACRMADAIFGAQPSPIQNAQQGQSNAKDAYEPPMLRKLNDVLDTLERCSTRVSEEVTRLEKL